MKEMQTYADHSGKSIVKGFSVGSDSIIVLFVNGEIYKYAYSSAGIRHVETMKNLAQSGRGLGEYISNVVKQGYSMQLQ